MSWTILNAGVEKTLSDWELVGAVFDLRSFDCDTLKFTAKGRSIDSDPLFAPDSMLTLKKDAVAVFVGVVDIVPGSATGKSEEQQYVVKGPWVYFEDLTFEAEWNIDALGDGVLVPTLRTTTIIGSQGDGTHLDLGQMAGIVLDYVLSIAASYPVPFVPFQKGVMVPDITIPWTEVKDLKCAQILKSMFTFVPDACLEFDYSTTPPRLNVSRRNVGTPVSLPAYSDEMESIKITPKTDLVVPAVVVKYCVTTTIDGDSFSTITPDVFPVGALNPAFKNLVVDIDLSPGNATFQKQKLETTDAPKDYDAIAGTGALSTVTWAWLTGEHRSYWLRSYTIPANWPAGQAPYIQGNTSDQDVVVWLPDTDFQIRRVVTTLLSSYQPIPPATGLVLSTGTVPPGGGPGTSGSGNALDVLDQELIGGSVPAWLTDSQAIYSAHVNKAVTVQYLGGDPVVQAWFSPGPTRVLTLQCPVSVTNGSTGEYSQLSSLTPAETPPVGLAQSLYEGLSVLHYAGTINWAEQECSMPVRLSNVLNLTGGVGRAAAWATMNAQIYGITYNLDHGRTTISVGPPKYLDAGTAVAIYRATRGRIQSFHLQQQQTGKSDGDNAVGGAGTTARSGSHAPPGGSGAGADTQPYAPSDASAGGVCMIAFTSGTTGGYTTYSSPIEVAPGTGTIYIQTDFNYTGGTKTVVDSSFQSTTGAVPVSTCAAGSGTLYQPCASYTATLSDSGVAKVVVNRLIGGSQEFGICTDALSGPWGV